MSSVRTSVTSEGGCCSATGCCGGCLSITTVIFIVAALATPWYMDGRFRENSYGSIQDSYVIIRGWQTDYCATSGVGQGTCPSGIYNWRHEYCQNTSICDPMIKTYDASGALLGLSLIAAIGLAVFLNLRCCRPDPKYDRNRIVLAVVGVGFLFLFVSVVQFATELPKAYREIEGPTCVGPCESFIGLTRISSKDYRLHYPYGWWTALTVIPFFLGAYAFAFCRMPQTDVVVQVTNGYQQLPGPAGGYVAPQNAPYGQPYPQQYAQPYPQQYAQPYPQQQYSQPPPQQYNQQFIQPTVVVASGDTSAPLTAL